MGITLILDEDAAGAGLWEAHLPAWRAWCAISGQWRTVAGMGGVVWLGLDYSAARDGLALAGLEVGPEVWAEIRAIEAGAAGELNRE